MCAICGVVNLDPSAPVDVSLLLRMRDSMVHRGPDDSGLYVKTHVGLGHRRLSIIDLGGGHQPMANADETLWITYNGEVYNFQELRAQLEARGCTFRTKSDTEVILQAYEIFGESCVEYLRGMFAFAIWDGRRSQLFLARDRLGIKPLYYTLQDGMFLFASEIKAILQCPAVLRTVDPIALKQYVSYRYVAGPRTMFKGIFKLQPGHMLLLRDGALTTRQYWDLPLDGETIGVEDATGRLHDLLAESVGIHLVSDVPLGVFLSGGLDSTAITGLMANMVADTIQSFCVSPRGARIDETPFARLAAGRFRTAHRELPLDPQTFWDFLPRMVWSLDEPVADPAAASLYFLSRFAREFVTVALSGEGADEILAGYAIYPKILRLQQLRQLPGLGLLRPFVRGRKLRRYLDWARLPLHECYRGVSTGFWNTDEVSRLLVPDLAIDDDGMASSYFDRTVGLDPLRRMLYFDLKVWLPDDLLVKADKMTMATSLELRVPFLDHKLVEWSWRLPSDLKLRGTTGKYLLRKASSDFVPAAILQRPKEGFTVPTGTWFRNGLAAAARRLLIEDGHVPLFDAQQVDRLIARHERGIEDLSEPLFALVVLAHWHRIFIEASLVEPPPPFAVTDA